MIVPRETVYAAFWALVSNSVDSDGRPAFVTKSRRLKHWDAVPADSQPALFMIEHRQQARQVKGLAPSWSLDLSLFIYDHLNGNEDAIPGQRLNNLLDAVDNSLVDPYGFQQTLGGLVSHCWMTSVDLYEGYEAMMDQSVAILSFEIHVPDASGPV